MELLKDLPAGPLDVYRKKASFSWKKMRLFMYSNEDLKMMNEAYNFLETEPIFQRPSKQLTLEEERRVTFLRMKKIYASKIFYPDDYYFNMVKAHKLNAVIGAYDWSLLARKGLLTDFAISGIYGLGTERHLNYILSVLNNEMGFAFCLTEIAHGTNTKAMRTEAKYDQETKSFIIHTPDFEAAKCWVGCLGKIASHCLVFAQLFMPDGKCHGLHSFIVPVRNPQTLQPYPGVTIIDMGPKLGLNGIDNGLLMLNHYSVPRENLLNKTGDVTEDGLYVSPYKDPMKRFGASLGNLSAGRVGIINFGVVNLQKALTIALRYSAVRKQFGPKEDEELAIIEYPLHQWRLFPFLSGLYVLQNFSLQFMKHWMASFNVEQEGNQDLLALYGQEIHALSCFGKPYSSWLARDAIQECREACGGHGYLKAAGIGSLRDDNDAALTYEGDNNVLLAQTSNWLLSLWVRSPDEGVPFPMRTADFLPKKNRILQTKWSSNVFHARCSNSELLDRCIESFEWLVCWLCKVTSEDLEQQMKTNDVFTAKNSCQVFRAHTLALAYGERVMLVWFRDWLSTSDHYLQPVLRCLGALFGLTRLTKHSSLLVEGGLLTDAAIVRDANTHVKRLLKELLPDAIALVDAVAPPDFFLQSVLGNADGKVYDHLYRAMITAEGALTRDSNWQEISYKPQSKL